MAEALLNHLGQGRFRAYSAGSSPRERQGPNPLALETLRAAGIPVAGLSSKSWNVFAQVHAPHMDLIITVCDNAASEVCPVWPGHPATAHWGYADPSAIHGDEHAKRQAFAHTLDLLRHRLAVLVNLPEAQLVPKMLAQTARELARQHP